MIVKILVAIFLVASASALPSGAPTRACGKWYPQHAGVKSKANSTLPYNVRANRRYFDFNEAGANNITVTIEGKSSADKFKGFVIAAYDSKAKPFGVFQIDDFIQARNVRDCAETAVTHIDPREKSDLSVTWFPTPGDTRTWDFIQFTATVVKDYENFWVGVNVDAPPVK